MSSKVFISTWISRPGHRHRDEGDDRAHHPGGGFQGLRALHGGAALARGGRGREGGGLPAPARRALGLREATDGGEAMARSMTRAKDPAAAGRVAFVELFYDLVFVFAITQLSHLLLHHYTLLGARGDRRC